MKRYGEMELDQNLTNTIAFYMDDEKRETVHAKLAPCIPEEFCTDILSLIRILRSSRKSDLASKCKWKRKR